MNNTKKNFSKKFQLNELSIYISEHWIWWLRPGQATLGAGVLSLKRDCSAFSKVTKEEFSDLSNIVKVIEKTLKITFNYDIMNYLMLMMVDRQVHYHVIPRYDRIINFNDISWEDLSWPRVPNITGQDIEVKLLDDIHKEIRKHLIL